MDENALRDAYSRLETEVTTVAGNETTSSKPAVLAFPESHDITANQLNEALKTDDYAPVDPFVDDSNDQFYYRSGNQFYYRSGRIWRKEHEPDIAIKADADTLRIREHITDPSDVRRREQLADDELPELEFEVFKNIIEGLESELGIEFREAIPDSQDRL